MPNSDTRLSPTNILNRSYDPTYDLIAVIPMEENAAGTAVVRQKAIGKAEDSPHVTGDIGVPMWGVRVDAYPPSGGVFGADGDYTPIATNYKGDVKVVSGDTDGVATKKINYASKITVSGANTYVAKAAMGSSQASAVWQVKKINVTGGDTVITWCDSNDSFDNVATDLTALTYG